MFKTLCGLHNLLIKVDGLDTNWMGVEEARDEDVRKRTTLPPMLLRIHKLFIEQETSVSEEQNTYVPPDWKRSLARSKHTFTVNNKRVVRKMPQSLFVECLVEHFHILYSQNNIVWPRRKKDTNEK